MVEEKDRWMDIARKKTEAEEENEPRGGGRDSGWWIDIRSLRQRERKKERAPREPTERERERERETREKERKNTIARRPSSR